MSVDIVVKEIEADLSSRDILGKFIVVDDNNKLAVYGAQLTPELRYHIHIAEKFGISPKKVMGGGVFHYFAHEKAFELSDTSTEFGSIPENLRPNMVSAFAEYFKSKSLELGIDSSMSPLLLKHEEKWKAYCSDLLPKQ